MDELKNKFKKLSFKYNAKKSHFKKIINRWEQKGSKEIYKKGLDLFQELEYLEKELKEGFVPTVEQQPNEKDLRLKLKRFKKAYKLLNDLVKPIWQQWLEAIVVAGSLVFILRTYVFGLYHVPTGSAERTILVGDRICGNKMAYYFGDINRGDSVIFDNPEFIFDKANKINYLWQKYVGIPIPLLGLGVGPDNWVKRVIGIPGDVIEGRIEDGKTQVYINGNKLDESSYVNPYPLITLKKTTGFIDMATFGPFMIPSFLRKQTKMLAFTYDPDKSFDEQPFYNMTAEEIVRTADGNPILRYPYTPTYEYSSMSEDFGRSVDNFGPVRIPRDKYWVMGDSRKNSKDSRFWGFLDKELIHGRASFIIYSVDSEEPLWLFELLKHPIDFWKKSVRLNRFLKWIK